MEGTRVSRTRVRRGQEHGEGQGHGGARVWRGHVCGWDTGMDVT